ncbi:hypothetical protein [Agrobacterium pusense]|jgi:hypothetical protein|uniref:hypothetical protein n=1 Tax=Agrobacterium pusense TaxID=648995 RepID=UPI0037C0E38E
MTFPDDIELAVALYVADKALPRHIAIAELVKSVLEDTGYLAGGEGRPPEVVDGQSSGDYVQYRTYLDGDA